MRQKASSPEIVIVAVLVLFLAAGLAVGAASRDRGPSAAAGAAAAARRVAPIARHVEAIRGLRFKRLPQPVIVTPAQTRADSLRDLDRTSPPSEQRASAQVLEMLGLLKPGTDLRAVAGDVSGEQVAGYYDTRRKRLAIVSGPAASDGVLAEITLAHELDHALDDQAIGLRDVSSVGADDSSSAYTALVEGVATAVMDEYARRFISPGRALSSAVSALGPSGGSTAGIPPYLLSSLLFSYVVGERFVTRLRSVAGSWKLVNYALRSRPPVSTEQVIHPEKYLVNERPVSVRLRVPSGWKGLAHGTIGEFDTDQVLKLGVSASVAGNAAAGWGGGSYSLLRSGSGARALVVGWAWDTPRDASEFRRALAAYVAKRPGGSAVVARARGLRSALAVAPSASVAGSLASGALGR
jgi:hypothetical protein